MLAGKTAFITGSTSGIGYAIAKSLATAGAHVIIHGFCSDEEAARLATEFKTLCGGEKDVIVDRTDISKSENISAMMARLAERAGPIDIVVNNAGVQHVAPTEEFPADKWDFVIAVNMSSAFHICQAIIPSMKARGYGRIINVASVHGIIASANKIAYVAAKHGLVGMTKVMALELAGTGVTANCICPGWVDTPLVQAQIRARAEKSGNTYEEEAQLLVGEKQPSKAFVKPEDLGGAAVFLCSGAANQMTGANMVLDGGWTAQ